MHADISAVNLSAPAKGHFAFKCVDSNGDSPASGSHVTVVLPGPTRTLRLAEVIVLAQPQPPSPPLTPGSSIGSIVSTTITVSGTVEDVDTSAMETALASEYPTATSVSVSVAAGSVNLIVRIIFGTVRVRIPVWKLGWEKWQVAT